MILVAFLRDLAAEGREPTELELTRTGDMIRVSDNYSADTIYGSCAEGLASWPRDAGMSVREHGVWGDAW